MDLRLWICVGGSASVAPRNAKWAVFQTSGSITAGNGSFSDDVLCSVALNIVRIVTIVLIYIIAALSSDVESVR